MDQWSAWCAGHIEGFTALECGLHLSSSYRDESHAPHFDLIGGGSHLWSINLVYVTASAILAVGIAANAIRKLQDRRADNDGDIIGGAGVAPGA